MSSKESALKPIRVMIVDDHKAILWGLERLVESANHRMQVVATASSRVEMLAEAGSTNPDVILLDLDLNGENAIDYLPDLQKLSAARVLILTGDRDPGVQQAAVVKGARGVVGKDEDASVLLEAIEQVHAGEVWIDRKLMGKILSTLTGASPAPVAKEDSETKKIANLTPA